MSFEKIAARLDSYRNDMIDLQFKLTSIPAIAPSSGGEGEAKKADFLVEYLKANGFQDIEVIKAPDLDAPSGYRPNILAYYRGRSAGQDDLDHDPHGRRPARRAVPLARRSVQALDRGRQDLRPRRRGQPAGPGRLRSSPSRPSWTRASSPPTTSAWPWSPTRRPGSDKGIDYVLKHSKAFRPSDLIIVPDAGNEDGTMIEVAEKSILWLKFKILGKQTHGSTPEKGINAFKAASLLHRRAERAVRASIPSRTRSSIRRSPRSSRPRRKPTSPTSTPSPARTSSTWTCRILPAIHPRGGRGQGPGRSAAAIEKKFGVKISVEDVQRAPAAPPTSPGRAGGQGAGEGGQGRLRHRGQAHGHRRRHGRRPLPPGRHSGGLLVASSTRPPTSPTSTASSTTWSATPRSSPTSCCRTESPEPQFPFVRRRRRAIAPGRALGPSGRLDRVHMDLDGVLQVAAVAPGQYHGHGDSAPPRLLENEPVAFGQALEGARQPAQLVSGERVGPGQIDDEIGLPIRPGCGENRSAARPDISRRRRRSTAQRPGVPGGFSAG